MHRVRQCIEYEFAVVLFQQQPKFAVEHEYLFQQDLCFEFAEQLGNIIPHFFGILHVAGQRWFLGPVFLRQKFFLVVAKTVSVSGAECSGRSPVLQIARWCRLESEQRRWQFHVSSGRSADAVWRFLLFPRKWRKFNAVFRSGFLRRRFQRQQPQFFRWKQCQFVCKLSDGNRLYL